ncbi:MAG TPA: chemotaxis protein CheA, partial [Deltaproteobacteria bacterium]|nr:chemotaxis protein CheA [Deltaproteobacteria bacterium]
LAGMFGLDPISLLAHHLEDILDGLRLGRVSLDSPAIELLDEGVALLAGMMVRLEHGEASEADDAAAARAFIERIDLSIEDAGAEHPDELEQLDVDPSLLRALTEYEEHRLRESIRRGRHLALVDSVFEIASFEEGLASLSAAVREVGEVISTLPSSGEVPDSQIRFSLLVSCGIDPDRLRDRLASPDTRVRGIHSPGSGGTSVVPGSGTGHSASPDTGPDPDDRRPEPSAEIDRNETGAPDRDGRESGSREAPEIESLRSISETVRVDIRKLDELMNLVGELVIHRSAIADLAMRLSTNPDTIGFGAELGRTSKLLGRKLKELQAGVLDARMVPLRQIFEKLARVVRRLRRDLGKEVELEFQGAETELDKLIVEQLVDPLVHIVRNAFDHALEPEAEREAAGKPPIGRILVRAFHRGNHVVIEVADDGRGMDVEAIRSKAIQAGLIAENQPLTHGETLNLVFEAGLSTCESVSETSGRGVGMDVVASNLAEMGGMVDLASTRGQGTTVTIILPTTLAIIQALIVGVGGERFAIPLNSVLETLLVEPGQVGHSEGREVLDLRGEPLLLRRLADEFEIDVADRRAKQFVVVLGLGEQRLGLLVDRLEGQQDTVIKPIKGPFQQIRGISGATELGERGTILVIDVSAIVTDSVRRREAA